VEHWNYVRQECGRTICSMKGRVEEKGEWPCGVCKKGVGNN